MNIQDLCQEYNASQWDLTENDIKLIIDSGKEGKTWGEKTDIVMSKLCDLSGLDEYDVDEDKGLYLFYCKLCQLCESTMNMKEAKEILNENGFLVEDSMSLQDKIANAKRYNDDIEENKCIIQIIDRWNGVYKGFVGKVGDYVAEYDEAKIFDMNNPKAIKKAVINCLKYAIGEEDLNDLFSEVYIVPLKDGQPDLDSKIEYKL